MIKIYFNNQEQQVSQGMSIQDLLMQNNHNESHFAVAINNKIIHKVDYNLTLMQTNDRVDILIPMQGG
ncbi:MAG: sulfur carrier protein ThiS [Legionellaceae bacterium]|nr:sulfur carrier protein ThiS [Legionellaceae bacterium]